MRAMLVVAAAAACGGNSFGSVPIDQYASRVKQALCDRLVKCGEFPDTATCMGANIGFRLRLDPNIVAAVNAGKVKYDANKAGECLSGIAAASCDRTAQDTRVEPAACSEIIAGTVAAGAACALNDECISLSCTPPPSCSAGTCCQGTCNGGTPPPSQVALGGACTGTNQCAAGGYCDTQGTGTCTALKAAGATCTSSNECNYGLGCASGACAVLPATGQPCTTGTTCRDEGAYCSSANTCTAFAAVGATCSATALCSPYYTCDSTAHCATGPRTGQACTPSTSLTACFDDGTFCSSTTMTCTPLLADGATCTGNSQCENDLCAGTASAMTCMTAPTCI